jgi:hypothetical protein
MSQQTLFELNEVRVTAAIAQFGTTTYQVANIGSVRVVQSRKFNPFALAALLLGLELIIGALVFRQEAPEHEVSLLQIGGAIILGALILQLVWPWWRFVLIISMPNGDAKALTSRSRKYVLDVKKAIEEAFIARAYGRN